MLWILFILCQKILLSKDIAQQLTIVALDRSDWTFSGSLLAIVAKLLGGNHQTCFKHHRTVHILLIVGFWKNGGMLWSFFLFPDDSMIILVDELSFRKCSQRSCVDSFFYIVQFEISLIFQGVLLQNTSVPDLFIGIFYIKRFCIWSLFFLELRSC